MFLGLAQKDENLLTPAAIKYNPSFQMKGGIMADWGTIRYNKARGHFYIDGWWQGKRHYLSQYPTRDGFLPCTTEDLINRLKTAIDASIDRKFINR